MSSPVHRADDADRALAYAPPWVRDRTLPPAPQLSPVAVPLPLTRRAGLVRRSFSGDYAMAELQQQLALNPDKIPEPPTEGARALWPMMVRLGAVCGVAAVVAWWVVSLPAMKKPATETIHAAVPPVPPLQANRVAVIHVRPEATVPLKETMTAPTAPADAMATRPVAAPTPSSSPPALASAPPAPAAPPTHGAPTASSVSAAPPSTAAPAAASAVTAPAAQAAEDHHDASPIRLPDDEIAALVKRGKDLLNNGDIASARLQLRRAAEAGSADAALALGASFDPVVIARLGAIGAEADTVQARQWYQRAAELGSKAASQQLANLGPSPR